ncbi:MAG: sialate O-acetylesterase [Saprospiraceae bacterium]
MMKVNLSFTIPFLLLVFLSINIHAQNVKVFILAGQSNMQGHGEIEPENTNGTLAHFIENDPSGTFDYTQNADGNWATRDDVWVRYDHENGDLLADILGVGYGGYEGQIGPELAFGQLLGEYEEDQVLIIKTCWGGKNLAVDFRPPSSGGTVGSSYNQMISDVASAINNISTEFPQYNGGQIEIAGLCWFQGWNDGEEEAYLNEYEENLKNLIFDVRTDLDLPELPVVIGLTGNGGFEIDQADLWVQSLQTVLVPAQINAAEFTGHSNVAYAETRDFWRPGDLSPEPDFIHHWNNNAESYLRIGNEMGLEMIELLNQISSSTNSEINTSAINLFPCPTNNYFQIKGIQKTVNLNISTIDGILLKSFKNISNLEKINISDFEKGLYFIEILDKENTRLSTQRMIKE